MTPCDAVGVSRRDGAAPRRPAGGGTSLEAGTGAAYRV